MWLTRVGLAVAMPFFAAYLNASHIQSITVCVKGKTTQGNCPAGTRDSQQIVVGPNLASINAYAGRGITDEHSTVFPPGTLFHNGLANQDYVFFVAADANDMNRNKDIGALVLSAAGPRAWHAEYQWVMDFASADGYGVYPVPCDQPPCVPPQSLYGPVFLPPMVQGYCPDPTLPAADTTFDINYAAPGSIIFDGARDSARLLMIYEAVNTCNNQKTMSVGVATSRDSGHTWPTYRGSPYCDPRNPGPCNSFQFYPMPLNNPNEGPMMPSGATGADVCEGNDCSVALPDSYGRYLAWQNSGGEVSAFVDTEAGMKPPYAYVVTKDTDGLHIARGQLGATKLGLSPWGASGWGSDTPAPFLTAAGICGNPGQASISYVAKTKEYLLTFVCNLSVSVPFGPALPASAWYWATIPSLENPTGWSAPQQITGTENLWDTTVTGCPTFNGWYPTFMSLGEKPGHLSERGYVFYLWGDLGCTNRQYSSRAFTMSID